MIKNIIGICLLCLTVNFTQAQESEAREGNFFGIGVSYGLVRPIGDLGNRFGTNFQASLSLDWFKEKLNGSFGIEGYILFGDSVKEDVLANLRLENGAILGIDGRYADVFLRMRGNYLGAYIRKNIIPLKSNRRAGLALSAGVGLLQHNIRVQVDTNNAPNLGGVYEEGYDRHTVGPALKQGISYTHVGKSSGVNFAVSFEITEGFTKNQRALNFDTLERDDDSNLDIIMGLNFKWFIPLKDQRPPEEIFY